MHSAKFVTHVNDKVIVHENVTFIYFYSSVPCATISGLTHHRCSGALIYNSIHLDFVRLRFQTHRGDLLNRIFFATRKEFECGESSAFTKRNDECDKRDFSRAPSRSSCLCWTELGKTSSADKFDFSSHARTARITELIAGYHILSAIENFIRSWDSNIIYNTELSPE